MEENVQTPLPTTKSVGIRYGLILSVVSIILFLVIVLTGIDISGPVRWLNYLVAAVFVFLAHKNFKESGDGFMTYGQGIGIAFWMSLVSSVISSIFTYLYIKFIDGGFVEALKDKQLEEFQKKGMSDAQIDQAMKITEMFMKPESFLVMGIVFGIIGMIITALIVTIFTQKKSAEQAI